MKITIDDKVIELEKPRTVLDVALENGVYIPHFCDDPLLEKYGGCRMCLVEVEKVPRLQNACALQTTDGMIIRTSTPQIENARKAILEFLLINHPLDCPVCDKSGECLLQDYVAKYGPPTGRFKEKKAVSPEGLGDPLIVRNPNRCIVCTRCVRMCRGVQCASAINVMQRSGHSVIEPFTGEKFDCEYCGNCITVCPVGALMSKRHRYEYRKWQMTAETKSVCSFCGVGCTLYVQSRGNKIMRTRPRREVGANKGLLCNRGRFGYEYVGSPYRLKEPMLRKSGALEPASWEDTLGFAAKRLADIRNSHGPSAIAAIGGARCSNEDNFSLARLMKGIGSPNIDTVAGLGLRQARSILDSLLGPGSSAHPISDIARSNVILVTGGDPTKINPVLGIQIRAAYNKAGARVMPIGYAKGLSHFKTDDLDPKSGTEAILLAGLVGYMVSEKGTPGGNPAMEEKLKSLKAPSVDETARMTGICNESIVTVGDTLLVSTNASVIMGREAMADSEMLFLSAAIAYLSGAKVFLMSERPNEQGATDVGACPSNGGLSIMEIIQAINEGRIKALYVMGENPAFNLPDSAYVKQALSKLELLIVQDIFLNETAQMAHAVLPACSWAEKEGTYTNLEQRLQHHGKSVNNPSCREDWRIVSDIGNLLGFNMKYRSASDVWADISATVPAYKSVKYEDIIEKGLEWPYKGFKPSASASSISVEGLSVPPSNGKPFLRLERPLFQSGTLSRRCPALSEIYPEALCVIGEGLAAVSGIKNGDMMKITSAKGTVTIKAFVDPALTTSSVFVPNNTEGGAFFSITGFQIDPVTKAPVLRDAGETKIEKA